MDDFGNALELCDAAYVGVESMQRFIVDGMVESGLTEHILEYFKMI